MPNSVTDPWQHPGSHTYKYIQYGPHPSQIATVYKSTTNWSLYGGNPVILVFHAGSWTSVSWDQDLVPPASTGFVPNRGMQVIAAEFLSGLYGKQNPPFTLVSCEYRQGACGPDHPATYPSFGFDDQRDVGRAVQFFREFGPANWGMSTTPGRYFTWHQSAGSCNGMINLVSPSLPRFEGLYAGAYQDRKYSSRVAGACNWYGEITCVANEFIYSAGIAANPAGVNAALWGTTPSGPTDFVEHSYIPLEVQQRASPLHKIRLLRDENRRLKLLSYYCQNELGNNSGHDPRQFAELEAACALANITTSGEGWASKVIATNSTADLGAMAAEMYAFFKELYDGEVPPAVIAPL